MLVSLKVPSGCFVPLQAVPSDMLYVSISALSPASVSRGFWVKGMNRKERRVPWYDGISTQLHIFPLRAPSRLP